MGFAAGSSFGAAVNLVPFGMLAHPDLGVGTSYDANDNLQFTTPGGTLVTLERFDDLLLLGNTNILLALADDTNDGSAADTGVLVTAVAGANEHGLPANFGPGRGNWLAADQTKLGLDFITATNTVAGVTNVGGPVVRQSLLIGNPGDITLVAKNMSEVSLLSSTMRVWLRHTIIG